MMKTVVHKLLELYESSPRSIALHLLQNQEPDQSITYSDLIHGAAGYSTAIKNAGIHSGEGVLLLPQHSQDLVYAFFGAILNGSIPAIMPFLTEKLSPEQYRRSLMALFEITAPAAGITYPEFLGEVHQAIKPGSSVRVVLDCSQINPQSEFT